MSEQSLVAELVTEIIEDALARLALDRPWESYGLAAEVHDDGSTVQAAYYFDADGTAEPAPMLSRTFTLVELREAVRASDGPSWDVFVLKIHRASWQAATRALTGDEAAEWSLLPEDDARLVELLRSRPGDFQGPID